MHKSHWRCSTFWPVSFYFICNWHSIKGCPKRKLRIFEALVKIIHICVRYWNSSYYWKTTSKSLISKKDIQLYNLSMTKKNWRKVNKYILQWLWCHSNVD
jgi:hypothetical protein